MTECEDAISRQAVLDGIDTYINKAQSTETQDDFYSFAELVVKELQPVTPKAKVGKRKNTKHKDRDGLTVYRCSKCELAPIMYVHTQYCPWCGAKMESEDKKNE